MFARVCQIEHLWQIVGKRIVHAGKIALLNGNAHQRAGEGFGTGMEGEHAGLIIALLIIFIDDNAVLYCDHGIDIGTLQICMQLGENRWIHLMVFRQIDLPGSDDRISSWEIAEESAVLSSMLSREDEALWERLSSPDESTAGEPEQAVKAIMIVNKRAKYFFINLILSF